MTKKYTRTNKDLSFLTPEEIRVLGCPSSTFSFTDRFNELMAACNVSALTLSSRAELSRKTINRISSGETTRPTPRVILQIAVGLQLYPMDVEELFFLAGYNLLAADLKIYRIAIWRILDEEDPDCLQSVLDFVGEETKLK